MDACEDRDSWLEGVRRWYFGGAPGPDDEDLCVEETAGRVESTPAKPTDH